MALAVSSPSDSPGPSTAFLVVTFAAAICIAALVVYLGITGAIGGPIP
jgi:hypothetical protein